MSATTLLSSLPAVPLLSASGGPEHAEHRAATAASGSTGPRGSAGPAGSAGSAGSAGTTAHAAIVAATSADYHHVTGRPDPQYDDLAARTGQPVTVLLHTSDADDQPCLQAQQGTLHRAGARQVGLSPRGQQHRGWILHPEQILDVESGHHRTAALRARVQQVRTSLPAVEELTPEQLRGLPRRARRPAAIGLAVFATWYAGTLTSPGAIWLLHSYLPTDDIAEGYLILRPGEGASEHGTIFGEQLRRTGARILRPPALCLSDAFALGALPYHQVLARFVADHPAPQ